MSLTVKTESSAGLRVFVVGSSSFMLVDLCLLGPELLVAQSPCNCVRIAGATVADVRIVRALKDLNRVS